MFLRTVFCSLEQETQKTCVARSVVPVLPVFFLFPEPLCENILEVFSPVFRTIWTEKKFVLCVLKRVFFVHTSLSNIGSSVQLIREKEQYFP